MNDTAWVTRLSRGGLTTCHLYGAFRLKTPCGSSVYRAFSRLKNAVVRVSAASTKRRTSLYLNKRNGYGRDARPQDELLGRVWQRLAGGVDVHHRLEEPLDEIVVSVVPILLGGGARLFENVGDAKLEQVESVEAPGVTHIRYARA